MPVWCEVIADTLTPVACFANVVGEEDGFLFESVEGGERWGRYSFVGRRPLATLTARGRHVETTGRLGLEDSDEGILAAVEAMVARFQSPSLAGLPPLHGGLVGYLGYDVVRAGRTPAQRAARRRGPPRRRLGRHRAVLRLRPLAPAHCADRQRRGAGGPGWGRRGHRRRGGDGSVRGRLRAPRRAGGRLRAPGGRLGPPAHGRRTAPRAPEGRGGAHGERGGLQGVH